MSDDDQDKKVADGLLGFGTKAAVVLAGVSILGAGLLCWRIVTSSLLESQDELLIRLLLSVTALFIGMAFACLGFGLFLIRAKGAFGASAGDGSASAALSTNAPGLVVVVCATIVIALALNVSWTRRNFAPEADDPAAADPAPVSDREAAALILQIPNPYVDAAGGGVVDAAPAPSPDGGN